MKILNSIIKIIDTINDWLGRIFSVLVLGILGVIMCEVVMRRIFNSPQIWTQELTIMLFAMYVILICAYGFQKKVFVAVDVLYARFPVLVQHILHLVTYICYLVPFVFWILPNTWRFFMKAFTTGENSYSVWTHPTWPNKFCFFLGVFLLCVQAVSEMLKKVVLIIETIQENKGKKTAGGEEVKA